MEKLIGALQVIRQKTLSSERGQTSSEYLVIAGVLVIVILATLATFSDQLQGVVGALTTSMTNAINGQ